ncbi:MAG: DUF47 family protein [Endomicrobia bacterium]|nr:DUF47 family protein [Endomicrobiia bacterium]MCX7940956.1 DUF47 family protein [Endomicrobiia bacterium]MDW8055643.1 DUF47 family protein [Elusimicrobiota bacterium]
MGIRLFPKEKDFLGMLYNQAVKVAEGTGYLVDFINNICDENKRKVEQTEEEADELRRVLIDELNRSFVTPIDREDIFALSRAIDDVLDYAKSTVEEIMLFKLEADEYMKKMVEAIHNAAKEIMLGLKCLKSHPGVCSEHIVRAKKTENFVEHRYREALVKLFESDDIKKILKTREVYRHLSNAADRVDEAANIMSDILVKIT